MVSAARTKLEWPEGVTLKADVEATVRGHVDRYAVYEEADGRPYAELDVSEPGGQQMYVHLRLPEPATRARLEAALERAGALPEVTLRGQIAFPTDRIDEVVRRAVLARRSEWPLSIYADHLSTDTKDIYDLGRPEPEPWTRRHTLTVTLLVPDDDALPDELELTYSRSSMIWALLKFAAGDAEAAPSQDSAQR